MPSLHGARQRIFFVALFSFTTLGLAACSSNDPVRPKLAFLDVSVVHSSGTAAAGAFIGLIGNNQGIELFAADSRGRRVLAIAPGDYTITAFDPYADERGHVEAHLVSTQRTSVTVTLAP